jgi:RNA polymerase sigma factor (sigma-70 family)
MKNRHADHKPGKASVAVSTLDQGPVDSQGLVAIKELLKADLDDVRWKQEDHAKGALRDDPSDFELMLAVKRWARAIAVVCRSHAGRCAEIHAGRGEPDPASAAMGTILLAVADHLGLPADETLLSEDWPEENNLRNFVLYAAGAPIRLIDGDLVTESTIPRWEPKSRLARRMANLSDDRADSSPFLSVDETRDVLRGLEESFRATLLERIGLSFSEARVKLATQGAQHPVVPKLKSPAKQKLGAKQQNLSNYIDGARLTEKQQECFSLRMEYGLPIAEVARHLGITRKTVDEHIAAAKKKLEQKRANDNRAKNRAKAGIL